MAEESAEELRERYVRDMGPQLGGVYHLLWNEVAWLHAKWNQYRQLYAHSPDRVEFLNKVGGHFFGIVQRTLRDDILLHLARLTDPPKSNRLTLQRLPKLAPEPALRKEWEGLVRAACKACEFVWSSRNQRIAHTDLERARACSFDDIPSPPDVEAALLAIRAVMIRLETHCWPSDKGTSYQDFIPEGRQADSVVSYLLKGVRAEEGRMERLIQGEPLPEDLEPEDEV